LFDADKTVKLWKLTERNKRPEGLNLKDDAGLERDPMSITALRVPTFVPTDSLVEATPRRIYANAHTYHINSVSVNSDEETFLSADDLRINLWHIAVVNQSFSITFSHQVALLVGLGSCGVGPIKLQSSPVIGWDDCF